MFLRGFDPLGEKYSLMMRQDYWILSFVTPFSTTNIYVGTPCSCTAVKNSPSSLVSRRHDIALVFKTESDRTIAKSSISIPHDS